MAPTGPCPCPHPLALVGVCAEVPQAAGSPAPLRPAETARGPVSGGRGALGQALTSQAFIFLRPCRSCSIFSSTPLRPQMSKTVRPCWYPTSCTHTRDPGSRSQEAPLLGLHTRAGGHRAPAALTQISSNLPKSRVP